MVARRVGSDSFRVARAGRALYDADLQIIATATAPAIVTNIA